MMELITQFHFLRPLWLLMLLPCLILIVLLWQQQQAQGSWTKVIAPELLPWLLEGENKKPVRWPLMIVLFGWVITCLALSGPTWIKQPVPVSKSQKPLVVAVDLSFNMYAADLSPNRLTRTRFKLQDLFNLRSEGLSALVAYAGSAHTVAPLTDDSRTLNNLVKALSPDVMPVQGSNPVEAVRLAKELITQGSNDPGDILLVTGSMSETQAEQITNLLKNSPLRLSILGTGTEQGAPIPLPEGGYLKDKQGTIIVPQLDQSRLQTLARANGGHYQTMTLADTDLKALVPTTSSEQLFFKREPAEREFDQWYDAGYWLVWLLLPAALLGFRRGWLMVMMITLLPIMQDAKALSWDDLWQTRDQQGQKALQAGNPELAATLFSDPPWKSEALFQNQQFEAAASLLDTPSEDESASTTYNHANALAKAGKLQEALKAYDQALSQQPDMEDAKFNRNLVEQFLNQRSQQDQQQDQSQQNQESGQDKNSNQKQQGEQEEHNQQQSQSQEDEQNSSEQKQQSQPNSASNDENQQQSQSESQTEQSEEKTENVSQKANQTEQNKTDEQTGEAIAESSDEQPLSPEQQAIESWLRTIPDDPGGLLRRKFLQQQRSLQQENRREGASW